MKLRVCRISLLAVILAVLAILATPCPTRADEQVPFKGKDVGAITLTDFSFPFATFGSQAEGEATHLGHFRLSGQVVIDVTTGLATGDFTLTAANGNTLSLVFEGYTIDATHGIGNFMIIGGTGRFYGATGGYTDYITFALPLGSSPNPFFEVFDGTISSPGSNKR
jgi:hypothetical protein